MPNYNVASDIRWKDDDVKYIYEGLDCVRDTISHFIDFVFFKRYVS